MTTPERLSSALVDRYRIERELGAGGMATVYLAEDLKHKRKVAVKVLKPELAAVLGADRFVQEITTTASLQHPHILPLFDSGTADGFLYYVMPFIEGETLRDKLNRETQLGVDEGVRIAREVADALDYAHSKGVIHRDIKPENILIQNGRPMVADFGIALAVSAAAGGRMTETGLSLGTPHYMSPEQATAEKEISARSDVYSLASVLYEMLAGQPPHSGGSAQQIIMKIIAEPVETVTRYRKSVPPNVAAALAKALEKLPADRFESAAKFADALRDTHFAAATSRGTQAGSFMVTRETRNRRRWMVVAVALNPVLIAAVLALWLRPTESPTTTRQQVLLWQHRLPDPLVPGATVVASQAAIAPDGSSIVFSDSTPTGFMLMSKPRDAREATPLAGTDGGVSPFFSPDGKWVGYVTLDGKVRKVSAGGGGSVTLAEGVTTEQKAAAWLDDQTIVYADGTNWMSKVSADGAPAGKVVLQKPAGNVNVATIWPLPGSRGFLFTACNANCAIESSVYVYDLAADSARLLVPQAAGGWYSPTGHLLYTSRDGGLYAAPFDAGRMVIRSGAVPVVDEVEPTRFTISASGAVLYSVDPASRASSELVWVTRDGRTTPLDSTWRGRFEYPALSPDGASLAVSLVGGTTDLWIRRADGTRQKVIAEGVANWRSSWMPDGKSLAFISVRNPANPDDAAVYLVRADGGARAELLLRHTYGVWEAELSHDGQWLVVRSDEQNSSNAVYARRLGGDTTMVPLLDRFNNVHVALSPDSRWLAYSSDESGQQSEVYVASFPDMSSKRLVSRGGGGEPRWARSGRELFFKSGGEFMVVAVPPGPSFNPGNPRALFPLTGYRQARNRQQYDVAPGDQRFVMIRESGVTDPAVVYAEHWFAELLAKVKR